MKFLLYLAIALITFSCGNDSTVAEDIVTVEISTNEIDEYVNTKLDDSQEYDVALSLRFSKGNDTYEVVQYIQNDTVILFLETEIMNDSSCTRNTFFKDGAPVYVEEYLTVNSTEKEPFIQRKIYFNSGKVASALERKSFFEGELQTLDYSAIEISESEFDFNRPKRAINQEQEFALQFEEFLIIDPQTYLILGNKNSGYDAALFVSEEHQLLTEINENQEKYKGKTLHVYHQFVLTNGIERMLFIDAEFKEEN